VNTVLGAWTRFIFRQEDGWIEVTRDSYSEIRVARWHLGCAFQLGGGRGPPEVPIFGRRKLGSFLRSGELVDIWVR
jgi:hypothetical protein